MTPKFSLIIVVAVVALTVAVPTAFGQGRPAGSQEPVVAGSPDAFERAVLAQQQEATAVSTYPDAFERAVLAKQHEATAVSTYRDAFERAVIANQGEPQWMTALRLRSEGLNKQYGLGEFAQSNVSKMSPPQRAEMLRSIGLNKKYGLGEFASGSTVRDSHERAEPVVGTGDVSTISSGREIEWPKIGIGLGIGIVLVLGLILGLKATRNPPLAH